MIYTVQAPGLYANAQLNGSECVVDRVFDDGACEVLFLDGPEAGRFWQFRTDHLRAAHREPGHAREGR